MKDRMQKLQSKLVDRKSSTGTPPILRHPRKRTLRKKNSTHMYPKKEARKQQILKKYH